MSDPQPSLPLSLETSTAVPGSSALATGIGGNVTEELAAAYNLESSKEKEEKADVAPSHHKRSSFGSRKSYSKWHTIVVT